MSLVDELPPVLSPLSPISPDTLTSVLGGTSPRCDIDHLIGDMTRNEKRGGDVISVANANTPLNCVKIPKRPESKTDKLQLPFDGTKPSTPPVAETNQVSTPRDQNNTNPPSLPSTPVRQSSIFHSLASQPQFSSLQQALQAELQGSPSTVPHSLLPSLTTPSAAVTHKIPITSRAAMLQVRFVQLQPLFPATTTSLKDFYHMQSTSMETSRYNQLCLAANTPWLKPSINYYFDLEHHSLIDNFECRLECLKTGTMFTPPGVGSPPAILPTPPLAHTKLPMPKSSPLLESTVRNELKVPLGNNPPPCYTVPQALSTPPFMAALPPINSPGHLGFSWFSPPQRDNCGHQSPMAVFPQPTISPIAQIPESGGNSKKNPWNKPLSAVAVRVMQNWYERNAEHPYPSHDTCSVMAQAGGITVEQVKKWFANKRLRNGQTKSIKEIARRRKLPLDVLADTNSKKVKVENTT